MARPKIDTATLSLAFSSSTSSTNPLKEVNGPSQTRTCSPISKVIDGFGRSMPSWTWRRMRSASASGIGIVEGWRGTIVHRVELAADWTLTRVKIADPSFFNWPALPVALTGAIVPDFPLVNKSFNLSYAGNDL